MRSITLAERSRRWRRTAAATWPQTPLRFESLNFDQPLVELLDTIDFAAIAIQQLVRFSGYRRRASVPN
jgi:hypothetical protein